MTVGLFFILLSIALIYLLIGMVLARAWYRAEVKRIRAEHASDERQCGYEWPVDKCRLPRADRVGSDVIGWPVVLIIKVCKLMCDLLGVVQDALGKIVKGDDE